MSEFLQFWDIHILSTYVLCPIFLDIPTYPKIGHPLWTFARCMYCGTYNHPALQLLYKINIIVQFFRSCANESGAVRTHQSMSELKDSRRTKVSHAKMGLSDEQFSGRSSKITCSRVSQTVSLPVIQSRNGATKRILKSNHGFY